MYPRSSHSSVAEALSPTKNLYADKPIALGTAVGRLLPLDTNLPKEPISTACRFCTPHGCLQRSRAPPLTERSMAGQEHCSRTPPECLRRVPESRSASVRAKVCPKGQSQCRQ